ncbi:ABC transporter permease [Paenibacillaceae bacterium WGS1546]|uniref:ABC transporter permease n=1 Tax=Cohnella sp. WGS1546 TaxID=3366810 RepID=UPI00372D3932
MSQSMRDTNVKPGMAMNGKEQLSANGEDTVFMKMRAAASSVILPLATFVILFVVWELAVRLLDVKTIILPAPTYIFAELFGSFSFYLPHIRVTFYEAIMGFLLGTFLALVGGVLMSQSRLLERMLLPLAVLANVTPIVVIAPLFMIWFGFGSYPKILISAICTFFPMLINSIAGFRSVDENNYEYMRSLHASKLEIFIKLRFPNSLPYLFAAARTCMSMCVIGAVVGEMYGSTKGLGNVVSQSANYLEMDRMFSAIILLAAMGILMTNAVRLLERRLLSWHR